MLQYHVTSDHFFLLLSHPITFGKLVFAQLTLTLQTVIYGGTRGSKNDKAVSAELPFKSPYLIFILGKQFSLYSSISLSISSSPGVPWDFESTEQYYFNMLP